MGILSVQQKVPPENFVEANFTPAMGGLQEQAKEEAVSKVFLMDSERKPLDPIHPGWARHLLSSGQAAVLRRAPFTLILKRTVEKPNAQAFRLKLDPGSRTTGIAIVNENSGEVVFAAELVHRGEQIKKALSARRIVRRSRRRRHTSYRKPRFCNRRRHKGWLPPSLMSRIYNIVTWVQRLLRLCPLTALSLELVRFDLQALEHPDINGIEYQQGTLAGYELREYLLLKWGHACVYCGKQGAPLQMEHIVPHAKGGSDRISNLCIACNPCNQKKGTQDVAQFLKKKPELLKTIQAQAKAPLKDAAAVNITRWALFKRLKEFGLPIECGSGGRTKYNRLKRGLPKTHWLDAACVGQTTPELLHIEQVFPLVIEAKGHGNRQMGYSNKYGFIVRHRKRQKRHFGYQTGDLVRAVVPKGKNQGVHLGRVLARASGSFDLATASGKAQSISYHHCRPVHQSDGYSYIKGVRPSSPASMVGVSCR